MELFQIEPEPMDLVEGFYFLTPNADGTFGIERIESVNIINDVQYDETLATDSVLLPSVPTIDTNDRSTSFFQAEYHSNVSPQQPSTSYGHNSAIITSSLETRRGRGRPRRSQTDREAELAAAANVSSDHETLKTIRNNVSSAKYRDKKTARQQKIDIEEKELEKKNKDLRRINKRNKKEIKELKRKLHDYFEQLKEKRTDQQ